MSVLDTYPYRYLGTYPPISVPVPAHHPGAPPTRVMNWLGWRNCNVLESYDRYTVQYVLPNFPPRGYETKTLARQMTVCGCSISVIGMCVPRYPVRLDRLFRSARKLRAPPPSAVRDEGSSCAALPNQVLT